MAQNPSYTYTPTFMEKILGRNYKWWYVILYNFKANLAYRTTAFFIIFRDLTPLIISLTIYGSLTDSNQYLNYFLFGNLFFKWLTLFADINWEISYAIKDGTLSKYLMSPIGWLKYEFFAVIGGNFYPVLINSFICFVSKFIKTEVYVYIFNCKCYKHKKCFEMKGNGPLITDLF